MRLVFLKVIWLLLMIWAPAAFSQTEFVIALKPDKDPQAMIQEREKLQAYLSKSLKIPVRVIIPLSGAVIQEGLSNGSIDLAFISGVELYKAKKANSAELLLAVEIEGRKDYESYWVSLKEKPYQSIKDLKNKPIAFASRTSTSGYLIPMSDLISQGLVQRQGQPETFFGKGHVSYGTGYVSAIERVFSGQAEAAAVSDYVLKENNHLTAEQKARLKVIDRQGPVPTHVLAIRSQLNEKFKNKVKTAFLNLNQDTELRNKLFVSRLVAADPEEHLKPVIQAFENTGLSWD